MPKRIAIQIVPTICTSNTVSVVPNEYISLQFLQDERPGLAIYAVVGLQTRVCLSKGERVGLGRKREGTLSTPASAQHQIRLQETLKA